MNQRERILVIAIVLAGGGIFAWKVAYPTWVQPMFRFDEQIARLETRRDDLEYQLAKMEQARETFRDYVHRTAGTDEKEVGDRFTSKLNELLKQCRLEEVKVSPKAGSTDRKTGLVTLSYGIRAEGPLEQAILFLKSFYELPYVARFRSLKLAPKKQTRRRRGQPEESDIVTVDGTIDVKVLPAVFVVRDPAAEQPSRLVKYQTDHYALIWQRRPFTRPVEEEPDRVAETPTRPREPRTPPRPGWAGDPKRNQKRIAGCWATAGEVTVVNTASKLREYVRVGEELDGGELLMVHPYGALVHRTEGNQKRAYLYPLKERLADAVPIEEAADRPQLRAVAYRFLAEHAPPEAEETTEQGAGAPEDALAGPPADLAGPVVPEGTSPRIDVSPRPLGMPAGLTVPAAALAGPPAHLAGPLPDDDGPPAKDLPPAIRRDDDRSRRRELRREPRARRDGPSADSGGPH
jgi:hypothetical protein